MALDDVQLERHGEQATEGESARRARLLFGRAALLAGIYTYLLITAGGIVRISGSGLGCGDDWPRCNGQWIPLFDLETFIEWFHRLLAAGMLLPVGALLLLALLNRNRSGFGGRRGLLPLAVTAMILLLVIATFGMITVKMELPAAVTAIHFGLANLLLGLLVTAGVRAGALDWPAHGIRAPELPGGRGRASVPPGEIDPSQARRFSASASSAAGLAFVLLILGALTANVGKTPGVAGAGPAAWACGVVDGSLLRSFPLCNGRLWPSGGGLVLVHWLHRLAALLLTLHVLGAVISLWRRGAPVQLRWAATLGLGLIGIQILVAAHLILFYLPTALQVVHLLAGVAVWVALVAWRALATDLDRQIESAQGGRRTAAFAD